MKILSLITFLLMSTLITTHPDSIHQYKIQGLNSTEMIDFESFSGKKILVVNVASKCGFTPQYEGLEALHQQYKDKLVIIGVPCNQFLGQEPGSEEEIASFCQKNYGVTFPITTKVDVKGKDQHEIYKWLTDKDLNGKDNYKVSWNFNKFLLDEDGYLIDHFPSKVKPMSEEITSKL